MIHVEINRPVGEDQVGLILVHQHFREFLVPLSRNFTACPVDDGGRKLATVRSAIVQTIQPNLQDFSHAHGVQTVLYRAVFGIGAGGRRGSAGDRETNDFVALVGKQRQGSTGTGLGVIKVATHGNDP
jgi:hypothetical protein